MKPKFITFTGADDQTSIDGMVELSKQYPVEFGILFSPKQQGTGRYPSMEFIKKLEGIEMELSAHLCGGHSRELIATGVLPSIETLIESTFSRVQINTADPSIDPYWIDQWATRLGCRAIIQCRKTFPEDRRVDWLFDTSGGRGTCPDWWPTPDSEAMVGYAGGISDANVASIVKLIDPYNCAYWLDMESGVRTDDKFDLNLCRKVCEAVYG